MPSAAPVLCVSPHLDDAVLSCGQVLSRHPGSTIVTVFAGVPSPATPLTEWDRKSGFCSGVDAMERRKREDELAAAVLGAIPRHLAHLDAQYGVPADMAVVARELAALITDAPVLVPLGLFHDDHRFTHAAAIAGIERRHLAADRVAFYEDVPYRGADGGGLVAAALTGLPRMNRRPPTLRTVDARDSAAAKTDAVRHYRSQLRALGQTHGEGLQEIGAPERYWTVGDAPWL